MLQPTTRAALTAALVDIEATANHHGWEQTPVLLGLFDQPSTENHHLIEIDTELVGPTVWHRPDAADPDGHIHPAVVLRRIAADLAGPATKPWLREWLHRDGRVCIGFGLLFEGWQAPVSAAYRHGDIARSPAHQRTEVRMIAAIDLDGHAYHVFRRRDDRDVDVATTPRPVAPQHLGRIATGLSDLLHLARAH